MGVNDAAKGGRVGPLDGPIPMDRLPGKSAPISGAKLSPQKRHGQVVGDAVDRGTRGNERRQRTFVAARADAEKLV